MNQNDAGGTIGPTPSKQSINHVLNGDSQSQISTDRESQSSGAIGQVGYINNPLYGGASQYNPSGTSTNASTPSIHNGLNNNSPGSYSFKYKTFRIIYMFSYLSKILENANGNALTSPINGVRRAPEGQDNESFVHEDETDKGAIVSASQMGLTTETNSATHYTSDKNGKINVHVTVMINTGTGKYFVAF